MLNKTVFPQKEKTESGKTRKDPKLGGFPQEITPAYWVINAHFDSHLPQSDHISSKSLSPFASILRQSWNFLARVFH